MIFLDRGEVLLRLRHRRISKWPPEGGTSTVCESLPLSLNAELFAKSEALLRRIGWEGVEYRLDPRNRTGGSHGNQRALLVQPAARLPLRRAVCVVH
jgi:hypothetical protein